ncbi:2-phospho-L-lactate guanylyltransferase [Microbulbifer elongatus]|uniref:2-phospho-L-lactate guanylyltransferase n=1 Tax=Microbulbifer elongatus TaxID=86173 RepID=UPI001CFF3C25|nr:2-phospho-L-lactate guanylyltransferase [Microbulbifer elongatus]
MWALLPLKQFAYAKQRLAEVLGDEERYRLFEAMVKDVLSILQGHPDIDGIWVVSDDPVVESLAAEYGAEWVTESILRARGLNWSVQAGVAALAKRGIHEVMVIHGDLPLLTRSELSKLVAAHRHCTGAEPQSKPRMTIVPDVRFQGSNCLVCSLASRMNYRFGNASFGIHVDEAERLGFEVQVVEVPGIMLDIDTPADLMHLVGHAGGVAAKHSHVYVHNIGLPDRLGVGRVPPRPPVVSGVHRITQGGPA